jgi:hypothetical protein
MPMQISRIFGRFQVMLALLFNSLGAPANPTLARPYLTGWRLSRMRSGQPVALLPAAPLHPAPHPQAEVSQKQRTSASACASRSARTISLAGGACNSSAR